MSSVNDLRHEPSPQAIARTAVVCFLITIVLGIVAGGYISGKLVVLRDPAATAANITANTGLFRVGFTLYLVEMAAQIVVTALFYQYAQARAPGRGAGVSSSRGRRRSPDRSAMGRTP